MHILLVDDHALFRGGLRLLLASLSPEVRFLEAANVEEAVAQAREHQDLRVCLLDLDLKQDHGLPAIGRIRQCAPNAAIVIVSAADDPITVRACIEAGAMSYITKSSPPDLLTLALRRVLDGEVALPRSVQAASDGAYRAHPQPASAGRTRRPESRAFDQVDRAGAGPFRAHRQRIPLRHFPSPRSAQPH